MLDFAGTIVTAALMVFAVNAVIVFMDTTRAAKLVLAGLAGIWIGLAAAAGAAGMLATTKPFPVIGPFVGLPLAAAAIDTAWPAARHAMVGLQMALHIGIYICRWLCVVF